jgi:ActR/RegA family two-component response regulator
MDGGADFTRAKSIIGHLACGATDDEALWRAAEAETRRFVRQDWGTILDLAENLVKRGAIKFDDAPASVLAIQRLEGNIAPLAPPDALRVHECAQIFGETGGKICETARRMGVCQRTVERYLSYALQLSHQPLRQ